MICGKGSNKSSNFLLWRRDFLGSDAKSITDVYKLTFLSLTSILSLLTFYPFQLFPLSFYVSFLFIINFQYNLKFQFFLSPHKNIYASCHFCFILSPFIHVFVKFFDVQLKLDFFKRDIKFHQNGKVVSPKSHYSHANDESTTCCQTHHFKNHKTLKLLSISWEEKIFLLFLDTFQNKIDENIPKAPA